MGVMVPMNIINAMSAIDVLSVMRPEHSEHYKHSWACLLMGGNKNQLSLSPGALSFFLSGASLQIH